MKYNISYNESLVCNQVPMFDIWMILFHAIFLAIPDDAPVLEESDNEDDMESDRRISSKCCFLEKFNSR